MTVERVSLARQNLNEIDVDHVECRLGEIEHLPTADGCVDVVMSNCVINLSPDKAVVFTEAMRVLKPRSWLAISDMVSTAPLPRSRRRDLRAVARCLAGVATASETTDMLYGSGFVDVRIDTLERGVETWAPPRGLHDDIVSATIEARKPA
jgi:arsenite methyltransferase